MMKFEVRLNIVICFFIFMAIIFTVIFISFDKKIGGNILNTKSYKTETSFYISDKVGNQIEVSEKIWNESFILAIVTFIFISLAAIGLFYLFIKYIFISTTKRNLNILFEFIKKHKHTKSLP